MDNRLLQAGIIAIPLKAKPESGLKPMPTHIVFDTQSGKYNVPQIDFQTGQPVATDCVQTTYKIVSRIILAPNEIHTEEAFMERVLLPLESLFVPVDLLTTFFSYERVKSNVGLINMVFSLFTFRGDLEGFIMEVDEDLIDEILAPIVTPVPVSVPVETLSPTPSPVEAPTPVPAPIPVPVETFLPVPVPVETPVPTPTPIE